MVPYKLRTLYQPYFSFHVFHSVHIKPCMNEVQSGVKLVQLMSLAKVMTTIRASACIWPPYLSVSKAIVAALKRHMNKLLPSEFRRMFLMWNEKFYTNVAYLQQVANSMAHILPACIESIMILEFGKGLTKKNVPSHC